MIQLAICDEDARFCRSLADCIRQFARSAFMELHLDIYHAPEELFQAVRSGRAYDLLFLDLMLEGRKGIEIGRYFREEQHNHTIQIVYVSAQKQYAMRFFKIRPLDFLIKPVTQDTVDQVLSTAAEILGKTGAVFEYKQKREIKRIYLRDILYFKGKNREVEIVTAERSILFYGKLQDIYRQLNPADFFYAHKSFLVNRGQVRNFYYDRLLMKNGDVLPIAQRRRREIREMQIRQPR